MPLPETTGDLFDLFTADAALQELLGFYSQLGQEPRRALVRLWPEETRDAKLGCSGVELVVARLATTPTRPLLTGEVVGAPVLRCYLLQWPVPDSGPLVQPLNLQAAVDRVLVLLQGQAMAEPMVAPQSARGLAQVAIRYQVPELVMAFSEQVGAG